MQNNDRNSLRREDICPSSIITPLSLFISPKTTFGVWSLQQKTRKLP